MKIGAEIIGGWQAGLRTLPYSVAGTAIRPAIGTVSGVQTRAPRSEWSAPAATAENRNEVRLGSENRR